MVVAEAVKAIGININVEVYDNATLKEYRDDPTKYDIFSSGLSDKNDPSEVVFLDAAWSGFWDNAEKDALVEQLAGAVDFEDRYDIWEQICELIYQEVPNITFGERINPIVYQKDVHNIFDTKQKLFWNTGWRVRAEVSRNNGRRHLEGRYARPSPPFCLFSLTSSGVKFRRAGPGSLKTE